ncbi:MAG: hypothetical protein IJG24_02025 [Selenomonadaceae bacterium]|nr:hypothetical protein [Selenomonadaceae bacterium]
MGFVFKRTLSTTQKILLEMATMKLKLKELWGNNLIISGSAVSAILAGTYISNGSDGEGETNGVPTDNDIAAILAGTYTSKDYELDEYAPDSSFEDDDIAAILAGNYTNEEGVADYALTISDEDIERILNGTY